MIAPKIGTPKRGGHSINNKGHQIFLDLKTERFTLGTCGGGVGTRSKKNYTKQLVFKSVSRSCDFFLLFQTNFFEKEKNRHPRPSLAESAYVGVQSVFRPF